MKTQTTQPKTNNDEDFVWYCTRCLSLHILDRETDNVKVPYCGHCGADVYKIDCTSFDRWEQLYTAKYGHKQIEFTSIYDDLEDAYNEEAEQLITDHEALENGMNVGNWINRKITE